MNMKSSILPIILALSVLTACTDETVSPTYTVGEADNMISLRAVIDNGGDGVATRAADPGHANHVGFNFGYGFLRVDGTWLGHKPEAVTHKTTATMGYFVNGTDNKHKETSLSPGIYWDNYGTADPANMPSVKGNGRAKGLTIYAVSVDGYFKPGEPPFEGDQFKPDGKDGEVNNLTSISYWTALDWTLPLNQSSGIEVTNGDLIYSNNIKEGNDGTLKFDSVKANNGSASDLLIFTHAMSKITVTLIPDEGFPEYGTAGVHFASNPTVTYLGFNYKGKVNVETKTTTATPSDTADIQAYLSLGGGTANHAVYKALVFPGNSFSDDTNIIKIVADGNTYYVTAKNINDAMRTAQDNTTFTQGKNYTFTIKVKKTKIVVDATIKDWENVEAALEAPEINISADYGQAVSGNAFEQSFDFYRSEDIRTGYDANTGADGVNPAATYTYASGAGSWDKVLYWPNHETHYFFRGVYPKGQAVTTVSGEDLVEKLTNVAYNDATFPSNLMIALPRQSGNCAGGHGKDVKLYGICATKGKIHMNFEYAMSKVEVRLKSTGTPGLDYVDLDTAKTTVEIQGGYTKGSIQLSDGLHAPYTAADKGNYTLHNKTPESGFKKTTLDAVMPQQLGNDVYIKITATNADGTKDRYTAQLNKICVNGTTTPITEWEHGKHYIYSLNVTKSQIRVEATITDWVTVNGSQNIWM